MITYDTYQMWQSQRGMSGDPWHIQPTRIRDDTTGRELTFYDQEKEVLRRQLAEAEYKIKTLEMANSNASNTENKKESLKSDKKLLLL